MSSSSAEHYAISNDVPARHLTVVVYPPPGNVTAATIGAGRMEIAEACTATTDGPPVAADPEHVTVAAQ